MELTLKEKFDIAKSDMDAINEEMTLDAGFNDTVEVWHEDGSYFRFNFARLVELDVYGATFWVVHTEHNGANVFFKDDVSKTKVKRMK